MVNTWSCGAIDHGVTIFPNGKIGPCSQVSFDYLKPIDVIRNPDRFFDLKTEHPPEACAHCSRNEKNNLPSYRQKFNSKITSGRGIQFLDIRNTNLCNLKCRFCGPHFSDKWGPRIEQDISDYQDILVNDSLHSIHFAGGEPLLNPAHWNLLDALIESGQSNKITLVYNTNITTLKYKDRDVLEIWKQFHAVTLQCSIDATGEASDYIRSGSTWNKISSNLEKVKDYDFIYVSINLTLSVLNIWFLQDVFEYAKKLSIPVGVIVLTGPDYLAIDVLPIELRALALDKLDKCQPYLTESVYLHCKNLIAKGENSYLFSRTLNHILLLDNLNQENLFNLLPFKEYAERIVIENFND